MPRFAAASLLATATLVHGQQLIFVDDDAPQGGDGTSWESAFHDLQDALAATHDARGPIEIRVGQGLYLPSDSGDPERSFTIDEDTVPLHSGITLKLILKGGFAGFGAKDPDLFDPTAFASVLSGDLNGDDEPGFVNTSDNSHHVVRVDAPEKEVEIAGLVIRSGNAGAAGGGAILGTSESEDEVLNIRQCLIEFNQGVGGGGAVAGNVRLNVTDSQLIGNASWNGQGGAVNVDNASFDRCRLQHNLADQGGAAATTSSLYLNDCLIAGNEALRGGALFALDGPAQYHVLRIERCTLANNIAVRGGAVYADEGAKVILRESLIWGNVADLGAQLWTSEEALEVTIYACNLQDGPADLGDGNVYWDVTSFSADPIFFDAAGDDGDPFTTLDNDYRIGGDSPCVDATMGRKGGLDVGGQQRLLNGDCDCAAHNDIGAFESQAAPDCIDEPRIFVDADAPDGGDGLAWETAFNDLALALELTGCQSEIWVAEGVYRPAPPEGDRTASFRLSSNGRLYGGFAGHESRLDERDVKKNPTVLSGDLSANDVPGFGNDENSLHVLRVVGAPDGDMVVIDGFTITGGNANVEFEENGNGGGILIDVMTHDPSIVVANCTIVGNYAALNGGGLYASAHDIVIENCHVERNVSGRRGGGAYVSALLAKTIGTTFRDNFTTKAGGGLFADGLVQDCLFEGNTSLEDGGGLLGGVPYSSRFIGNSAGERGGGYDGGLAVQCLFAFNEAPIGAGAASSGPVVNGTFYANDGVALELTTGFGLNCILWDNTQQVIGNVNYSCVQGGAPGEGNIDDDPRFVDAAGLDFRLLPGSPVIDAASNMGVPDSVVVDLAGAPRFHDDAGTPDTGVGPAPIIDMGVHEFQGNSCPADVDGDGELSVLDFVVFQIQFQLGDPAADCNGDGALSILDFVCFQELYLAGCP